MSRSRLCTSSCLASTSRTASSSENKPLSSGTNDSLRRDASGTTPPTSSTMESEVSSGSPLSRAASDGSSLGTEGRSGTGSGSATGSVATAASFALPSAPLPSERRALSDAAATSPASFRPRATSARNASVTSLRCFKDSSRIFSVIASATRAMSFSVNVRSSEESSPAFVAFVRASYSSAADRAASRVRRAPSNSTRRLSATAASFDAACSASKASRANRMASSSAAMSPISSKSASSDSKRDSSASGLCLFAVAAASSSARHAARNAARRSRGFREASGTKSRSSEVPSEAETTSTFALDAAATLFSSAFFFPEGFFLRPARFSGAGLVSGGVSFERPRSPTNATGSVCAEVEETSESVGFCAAFASGSVPKRVSASAGATSDANVRRAYVDRTPRGSLCVRLTRSAASLAASLAATSSSSPAATMSSTISARRAEESRGRARNAFAFIASAASRESGGSRGGASGSRGARRFARRRAMRPAPPPCPMPSQSSARGTCSSPGSTVRVDGGPRMRSSRRGRERSKSSAGESSGASSASSAPSVSPRFPPNPLSVPDAS